MKTIFYILSILVIGGAAYFSNDNRQKIQKEIDDFASERGRKINVEKTTDEQKEIVADTKVTLEDTKQARDKLISEMDTMKSEEVLLNRSKDDLEAKIEGHDAELARLAAAKMLIDDKLKGVPIPWAQVPEEIKRLQEERKKKGDDLALLQEHIGKLTKEVTDKRANNVREGDRLTKIRTKIGLNSKVGVITSVNSTWGFVIVNLGTKNSNVTESSKLLVTRNGRLLGRLTPNSVEASQTVCDLNARDITPGVRIQPGDEVTLAESVGQ